MAVYSYFPINNGLIIFPDPVMNHCSWISDDMIKDQAKFSAAELLEATKRLYVKTDVLKDTKIGEWVTVSTVSITDLSMYSRHN